MTIEMSGMIRYGYEWDELYIGDNILSSMVDDLNSKVAKLKYYISDEPIGKSNAVEMFLKSFYEGSVQADSSYCGSSWTGFYAKNDSFELGGHDIIKELSSFKGKYCYLEIEIQD